MSSFQHSRCYSCDDISAGGSIFSVYTDDAEAKVTLVPYMEKMMTSVYLLWHSAELNCGHDEELLLGVYASRSDAEEAQERVKDQPGFKERPNGFEVAEYKVGKDHWTKGFVVVR